VAKLLVSVRSAIEAREAVAGGAAIIDIKEPRHGSLGRASAQIWNEVLGVVPSGSCVSLALGELNEWFGPESPALSPWPATGVAYLKLGLSNARPDWSEAWRKLRDHLAQIVMPAPA
jgi:uncharacterized protein (UPF0264 family)